MFIVFMVSCDGGHLGHVYDYKLCVDTAAKDRCIARLTKPIVFFDKEEEFVPDTTEGKTGLVCWRTQTFVYSEKLYFDE